jgi:hypothetical protein
MKSFSARKSRKNEAREEKTTGKEIKKVEMFGKSGKSFYLCTPRNVII